MQIRRFFAKDMRSALADVSRELGPDAAILSSRQIGGGVELLAAVDYDPSVLAAPAPRSDASESERAELPKASARGSSSSISNSNSSMSPSTNRPDARPRNPAFDALFDELAAVAMPAAAAQLSARERSAPVREAQRSAAANRTSPVAALAAMTSASVHESELARETAKPGKNPVARFEHGGDRARAKTSAASTAQNNEYASSQATANAQQTARSGIGSAERDSLQAEWAPAKPAVAELNGNGGLHDLKEEVRQLRGLMQEQLQGLAWRELKQRQPLRAMLTKRLALLDLSPRLRDHYAGAEGRDVEQALATALANMTRDIVNGDDAMLDRGGIYAFVGATGVGKTTTIAKLAARFALQHGAGSVALISTDSYRIAGHDQLATYARLIGCAIRTADSAASLQDALDSFVDRRLILIDTAGMSQRDTRLAGQLAALASSRYPIKQLLVLSATAQRAILQESVKQFGQRRVHGAILTKLDETTSLGAVLSVLLDSRLPLMASCDGQRVPEDLRSLRGAQLVERALKLAEQFRESPDEWLLAQELSVQPRKATAHAGI